MHADIQSHEKPGDEHMGRDRAVSTILQSVSQGRSVQLIGVRKSGKTWVLEQVQEEGAERNEGLAFAAVNLREIESEGEFRDEISRLLGRGEDSAAKAVESAQEWWDWLLKSLHPKRPVVLVDHFYYGITHSAYGQSFYHLIASGANEYGVPFTLAADRDLKRLQKDLPALSLLPPLDPVYLGAWSRKEFRSFLGRKPSWLKEFECDIGYLAGRMPFFVQYACGEYERLVHSGTVPHDNTSICERMYYQVEDVCERIWSSLSHEEQDVVKALAHKDWLTQRRLIAATAWLRPRFDPDTVSELTRKGLIVDGALFSPLFTCFVRPQLPSKPRAAAVTWEESRRLRKILCGLPQWRYGNTNARRAILVGIGFSEKHVDGWSQILGMTAETAAVLVIGNLETIQQLDDRPRYSGLGALVQYLLEKSVDRETRTFLVGLVEQYPLTSDRDWVDGLQDNDAAMEE